MWIIKWNNTVAVHGVSWADSAGTNHPPNWDLWPDEEKVSAGLEQRETPIIPDPRLFTWTVGTDGSIHPIEKPIPDVKASAIDSVRRAQYDLLAQTDWAYIRFADVAVAVPADIKTYRDAVRAAAAALVAAINGATTTDEIATVLASEIMQWPVQS